MGHRLNLLAFPDSSHPTSPTQHSNPLNAHLSQHGSPSRRNTYYGIPLFSASNVFNISLKSGTKSAAFATSAYLTNP